MDQLLPAIVGVLLGDGELGSLTKDVANRRSPDSPKNATVKPLVTFLVAGGPDVKGLHGAATDPALEVKIWGYGNDVRLQSNAAKASRRIDQLLLSPLKTADGSLLRRLRTVTGWQDIGDTDPQTLHLSCQYAARYWSQARIAALTS